MNNNLENIAQRKQTQFLEDVISGNEFVEFLIMPNSICNLGCTYCAPKGYETKSKPYERMTIKELDKILDLTIDFKVRNPIANVNLEVHGYEPLLAGKDFFKYIATKILPHDIGLSTQTNGTLVDEEWANIFKEFKIDVGLSVDGPAQIHDKSRMFHSGKGSYNASMRGAEYMRNVGMNLGIISVLSKEHIEEGPEVYYDWLLDSNFSVADLHMPSTPISNVFFKDLRPSVEDLTNYMSDMYYLWKDRTDGVAIKNFALFSRSLIDGKPPTSACTLTSGCHKIISFGMEGTMSLCDSKVYEIGHIDDIYKAETLILHPRMTKSFMRPLLIAENEESCRDCDYLNICNGGCTHEALFSTGNQYTKTEFCEVYKTLYEKIEADLITMGKLQKKI